MWKKPLYKTSPFRVERLYRGFFIAVSILYIPFLGQSQVNSHYDGAIQKIYADIICLKLAKAEADLDEYRSIHGQTMASVHMASYIDFFSLFINEDADLYRKIRERRDGYLDALDKDQANHPWYRFTKAEILLQWALIDLKFDEKFKAGLAIYDAYKLLEENRKQFPEFIINNKSLSIIHVLSESLPSWVRTMFKIKGNTAMGYREINVLHARAVSDDTFFFREEVAAIHSYILFYQMNKKEQALKSLDVYRLDHTKSPLVAFLKSSLALKSGNNAECLRILSERPQGKDFAAFYYLDFMTGRSLLYKMDNRGTAFIERFIKNFKGQHYIKEAYQKLAWAALVLENDLDKYRSYMDKVLISGQQLLDEDQQAEYEASQKKHPNRILLKSRLQFDGGYYMEATRTLLAAADKFDKNTDDTEEYYYRLGRSLQESGQYEPALEAFRFCLDAKPTAPDYFGCSAALHAGLIYEAHNEVEKARTYFKKALEMNPSQYKTSLHQKAKSGLNRLE